VRFGAVAPELIDQINQVEDLERLKQLLRQAIILDSISDFQTLLLNE
jgi:hypothetical protein